VKAPEPLRAPGLPQVARQSPGVAQFRLLAAPSGRDMKAQAIWLVIIFSVGGAVLLIVMALIAGRLVHGREDDEDRKQKD
jgi:hypothetical protein